MQPFLALITPLSGGGAHPDNTLPVPPPNWDTFPKPMPQPPGVPTHPIYNPPVISGGPGWLPQAPPGWDTFPKPTPQPPVYPSHPIYNPPVISGGPGWLPQAPPGWDTFPKPMPQPPVYPSHPIYNPPYPDNTLPQPPLGIWGGGNVPMPTPPIYIPPEGSSPPLGIWGPPDMPPGPGVPPQPGVPTHPIVLPPNLPPEMPEGGKIEWKCAWTPKTGWIVIGVPAEGTLVPTPSKA